MSTTSSESYAILDYFEQLQLVAPWKKAMKNVQARAALPDIKHRRGLKEAHDKFNTIRARLDDIYASAQTCGNLKKMASVLVLVSRMCVDTLLSFKFVTTGLMLKVTPLLGQDAPTRRVALQALLIVAHHGGLAVAEQLATYNRLLIKLVEDYSNDEHTVKIAIAILATVTWCIFCQVEPPSSSLTNRISLPAVLRTAVAVLRLPLDPERPILLHALRLLVAPTEHCSDECRADPSLMTILAAVTRSKSLGARVAAVQGLMGLHQSKSGSEHPRPLRLLEVLRSGSLGRHLGRLLITPERSYTANLANDLIIYARLLKKLAQPTCDLYAVGRELADLVQRHDYVVSELVDDRNTGQVSVYFPEWLERIVSCARELRRRATSESDHDLADVLEMKVFIFQGRAIEARALGQRAIVRNPGLAYAYYTIARGAPTEEGLQAAKQGLRSSRASAFTRSQLLWVALEFAARIGLTLQGALDDSDPRVPSLFSSALKDARTFLAEAPPDHPSTGIVFSWTILLTILLQESGHEQELEACTHESIRRQLKHIAQLTTCLGYNDLDGQLQRTQEFICQEYDRGLQDWDHLVEGLGGRESNAIHNTPELGVNDLSWIHKLQGTSGRTERPEKLGPDELYMCSWCRKASARLKKCVGCKAEMYCGSTCQKLHWPVHRKSCARDD